MSIHTEGLAVISTAHVTQEEAEDIECAIKDGAIVGMARSEGWMVSTHQYLGGLPIASYVLGYLKAKGFDWVLFDRDASTTDELTAYDW